MEDLISIPWRRGAFSDDDARPLIGIRIPCPECGDAFDLMNARAGGGYTMSRYCSRKCGNRTRARKRYHSEGGQLYYESYRDSGKFAANSVASRARKPINESHECAYCGVRFENRGSHRRKTCGSTDCKSLSVRDSVNRSIAKRYGVEIEEFTHLEIFERDRWMCQLCGVPVDRSIRGSRPMAKSLDHVIPMSLGGAHTRTNVQLAHFGCNSQKGNRVETSSEMLPSATLPPMLLPVTVT